MEQPILDIQQLEVSYENKKALNNINLKVYPGEILGIVGESGSGKSTLIQAAIGLLGNDGHITSGDILFKGKSLLQMEQKQLRKMRGKDLSIVFQDSASYLCPIRTIGEQLYEFMGQHGEKNRKKINQLVFSLLEKMNLPDGERILKSYPFELSGGMNQRVGIMMSMLFNPSLLFADEPTSALDVLVQSQVVKELMQLREEFGTSIILVTHNMGLVSHMTDKVAVMYEGELMEYGHTQDVIANPQSDYTKTLIQAVPKIRRIKL